MTRLPRRSCCGVATLRQLDRKLQPLCGIVVEDSIGKTVGRITVQECDGLSGANEATPEAKHYICSKRARGRRRLRPVPGGATEMEKEGNNLERLPRVPSPHRPMPGKAR